MNVCYLKKSNLPLDLKSKPTFKYSVLNNVCNKLSTRNKSIKKNCYNL